MQDEAHNFIKEIMQEAIDYRLRLIHTILLVMCLVHSSHCLVQYYLTRFSASIHTSGAGPFTEIAGGVGCVFIQLFIYLLE